MFTHPVAKVFSTFYEIVEYHAPDLVEALGVLENFSFPKNKPVARFVNSRILRSYTELKKHVLNHSVFSIVLRNMFCKSTDFGQRLEIHCYLISKCLEKIGNRPVICT